MLFVLLFCSVVSFAAENCGCDVWFAIDDPDTTGTNIRSAPKGTVIMKIPFADDTFHSVHAVEFQNGWWKIDSVSFQSGKQTALKQAWIHNSVVTTGLDDGELYYDSEGQNKLVDGQYVLTTPIYTAPSYKSKSGKVRQGSVQIIGCFKSWLKIVQTYKGEKTVGWWSPEDQCPNLVTNCCGSNSGEKTGTDLYGNQ